MRAIKGHGLAGEGAPHDAEGKRIFKDIWSVGTGGEGRGKCSCGELSEVLPSGGARKRWHKTHKENL